jgi:serine/threonine-protein kinase
VSTRERDVSPIPDERDDWLGLVLAERYVVEERIGRGGMGVVYRGIHRELGKPVAIKRLDRRLATEALAFERFRREAIAASRVNSPYVVQVFDWGKASDDNPFIVMELLEGQNLRAYLDAEGRLEPSTAVAISAQILKGLHRIHQAHVLHRDLKPENVFLCDYDHERPFVKLLDFGISKGIDGNDIGSLTRAEAILGTAAYLSPEQVLGEPPPDVRSDLYSLGVVLYEMLVGHAPHAGKTYEATLVEICTHEAEDVRLANPLIAPRLAEVVRVALSRDRDQRFESAVTFLDALKGAHPSAWLDRASDPGAQLGALGTLPQLPTPQGSTRERHDETASTEGSKATLARSDTATLTLEPLQRPSTNAPGASSAEPSGAEPSGAEPSGIEALSGPSMPSYVRRFVPTRRSATLVRWLLGLTLAAIPLGLWTVRYRSATDRSNHDVNPSPNASRRAEVTSEPSPSTTSHATAAASLATAPQTAPSNDTRPVPTTPMSATPTAAVLHPPSPLHNGASRTTAVSSSPSVGVAGGLKLRRTMP